MASNDSHPSSTNNNNRSDRPLPLIEECLFGPSLKCPPLSEKPSTPSLGNFLEDAGARPSNNSSSPGYDSITTGRWGDAATKHDISIQQLRRIASQGIADEGSHRAVAWRVLLGFLPCKDISETWKTSLREQRGLYESLVKQYFEGRREQGKDLRGYHSRKMRNQKLRTKFHKVERLDYDSDEEGETERELQALKALDEDNESIMSEHTSETESFSVVNQAKILDRLPQKLKEQWKKSGIDLDSIKNMTAQGCNVALGINQLKLPSFDDSEEEQFSELLDSARLLEEIRKDVVRTHPDLYFFLEPERNLGNRRYAAIERILFIWSRLNKGVRYVQGMNEIVGTIYYVLANDINGEWATQAEADSYFLFNTLMIEMRDVFVPDMDDADTGIQGRITNMQTLLSTHDPALQEHLQDCGIDSSFYAIRWLTTLLSREFLLPDTIRMWDSMFASTHKENFLRYVCGTMVLMIREELLKGDFSSCLRLLQRYPPANVDKLLESSRALWIYESQITMACHKGGISLHQALSTISPPPAIIMAFGLRGGVGPRRSSIDSMRVNEAAQEASGAAQDGLLGRAMKLWSGWGSATATAAPNTGVTTTTATSAPGAVEAGTTISLDAAATPNTETKPPASDQPTRSPPPQPRAWNRGRNNTADTNDSTESINEATNSKPGVDSKFRSRIWGKAFTANGPTPSIRNPVASAHAEAPSASIDSALATGNTSATLLTPPRSRLWNRGARSTTPVNVHNGVAAPNSNMEQATNRTSPWTAPRSGAWMQDAMSAAPHTFAASPGAPNVSVDPMLPNSAKRNHMSDVMEILST